MASSFVKEHPVLTALTAVGVIGSVVVVGGLVTGETRRLPPLRDRFRPVPREIVWNPKAKRWQAPSGKFVKEPAT